MSSGNRLSREKALKLAQEVIARFRPACQRIEIAGSLRREKPDVGDIEIVCIPNWNVDLYGEKWPDVERITNILFASGFQVFKSGDHYKQFTIGPCMVDLFITTPECWGVIFAIRTGPADFSRRLVTPKFHGGFMPGNMRIQNGRVLRSGELLDTPEEEDLFRVYEMEYIQPKDRQ